MPTSEGSNSWSGDDAGVNGVRVAVLIPVKSFQSAKGRLSGLYSPHERAALAARMAAHVITCAAPLPVAVVCDDDEVAAWAAQHGALVLHEPGRGLNGAVAAGVEQLRDLGFTRVIVAHSDLPLAGPLAPLGDGHGITIVGDRHGLGTNVLVIPTDCGFQFAYGSASFSAHMDEAARLGLAVRVVNDAALALDVDTPDDLRDALAPGGGAWSGGAWSGPPS